MPTEDEPVPAPGNDRIDEAEPSEPCSKPTKFRLADLPRIVGVRPEPRNRNMNDLESWRLHESSGGSKKLRCSRACPILARAISA